jgi:acetylglutamate kinase
MEELISKAAVLHEALPYIRRFHGEIFVVKYGGHAMIDPELRSSFARDVVLMKYVGLNPIVVHGGGPQIDAKMRALGVEPQRVDGLRVTDDRTMEVVEMVLGGTINQEIVSLVCLHGGRAVGLTGRDDGFLQAEPAGEVTARSGRTVDVGRVGCLTRVFPDVVRGLVDKGFIPVVAPIAVDETGRSLNVNADTVAGALAEAIAARKLVLMTDTEGVRDSAGEIISSLSAAEAARLIEVGTIDGGMIPKIECALHALEHGVRKVHVIDGRTTHAVLLELFTDRGVGTEIMS